ncbi:MAG TPA: outer membrane beta-barrel protein, partial [Polyangiales bacterium]|nr:outer membrane beta-barrel protein [Polyangiales bacterium]
MSLSTVAAAQDEPPAEADDGPVVSLTFSPLHLLLPVFELTAEMKLGHYCGIALLGGFGSATLNFSGDDEDDIDIALWNLGAQVVAYPLEPFESLQLGVEVQYAHASVDGDLNGRRVSAIGSGLALGPLVGYKLIVDVGFTFFVQ